jgi:hypothetical protein
VSPQSTELDNILSETSSTVVTRRAELSLIGLLEEEWQPSGHSALETQYFK